MITSEQATTSISGAIADFMEEQNISQTQMAALLGMSANSLRSKRSGTYDWSWSEVLNLAGITGKTPDQLAGISG